MFKSLWGSFSWHNKLVNIGTMYHFYRTKIFALHNQNILAIKWVEYCSL